MDNFEQLGCRVTSIQLTLLKQGVSCERWPASLGRLGWLGCNRIANMQGPSFQNPITEL
jgi:hypothetical protein